MLPINRALPFRGFSSPPRKGIFRDPPTPLKNFCLETPLPSEFPLTFHGGECIFFGTTHFVFNKSITNLSFKSLAFPPTAPYLLPPILPPN